MNQQDRRTLGFRCRVMAGPVRSPEDPQLGETGLALPMEFWKVVVMPAEVPGGDGIVPLNATAHVPSRGRMIRGLMAARGQSAAVEGFSLGDWRIFQVRLRDVEVQTGLDFGPLRDFDPMARGDRAEASAPVALAIDGAGAILL